jgi:hypothetical protein
VGPKTDQELLRREKFLFCSCPDTKPGFPACSLVTIQTELQRQTKIQCCSTLGPFQNGDFCVTRQTEMLKWHMTGFEFGWFEQCGLRTPLRLHGMVLS